MGYERINPAYARENHPARKWTMEIMAGALYAMKEAGLPINARYIEIEHPVLRKAIYRNPGGWKKAVRVAGFDPAQGAVGRLGSQIRRHEPDSR